MRSLPEAAEVGHLEDPHPLFNCSGMCEKGEYDGLPEKERPKRVTGEETRREKLNLYREHKSKHSLASLYQHSRRRVLPRDTGDNIMGAIVTLS